MVKFRKKPVVIEAFQMRHAMGDLCAPGAMDAARKEWPEWFNAALDKAAATPGWAFLHANGLIVIRTLEGVLEIMPGDYVIQGIAGEIYPCKPDIFAATYDPVQEEDAPQ